jgi:hypothetical protein
MKRRGIVKDLVTESAETPVVIRTFNSALFRMRIQALVPCGTVAIFSEPPTFRHTPQVVFVEKFASISFFAQASKPMLANC